MIRVLIASPLEAELAEFALFAMLYFAKRMPLVNAYREVRLWERFAGDVVRARTVGVIGLGSVGREIARMARALGLPNVLITPPA
jgi:phosphoglycerate dehydrogenase-like enzyme